MIREGLEGLIAILIRGSQEDFPPDLFWKSVQEILLHLIIRGESASSTLVVPHDGLETEDAHIDVLQSGDQRHLVYDTSQVATSRSSSLVDLIDEDPPPVEAIELTGRREIVGGRAFEGCIEPSP